MHALMPSSSRRARMVLAAIAVLCGGAILSACSSSPSGQHGGGELWQLVRGDGAMEVDPPQSAAELVERAPIVVTGAVDKVVPGPDDVYEQPEGKIVIPTLIVHVTVDKVLKGEWTKKTIPVHMGSAVAFDPGPITYPKEKGLWFLAPSGIDDYYMTATVAGVWMPVDGALSTIRDDVQSENVIPEGVTTMDDAVSAVSDVIARQA